MQKMTVAGALAALLCLTPTISLAQAKSNQPPAVEAKVVKAASQREMKIFISEGSSPINEDGVIFPSTEWYQSKYDNKTTPSELLKLGWSLHQVVPVNAKQTYWIFVR